MVEVSSFEPFSLAKTDHKNYDFDMVDQLLATTVFFKPSQTTTLSFNALSPYSLSKTQHSHSTHCLLIPFSNYYTYCHFVLLSNYHTLIQLPVPLFSHQTISLSFNTLSPYSFMKLLHSHSTTVSLFSHHTTSLSFNTLSPYSLIKLPHSHSRHCLLIYSLIKPPQYSLIQRTVLLFLYETTALSFNTLSPYSLIKLPHSHSTHGLLILSSNHHTFVQHTPLIP